MPDPMNLESTSDFSLRFTNQDKRCALCGRSQQTFRMAKVAVLGDVEYRPIAAGDIVKESVALLEISCLICEDCFGRPVIDAVLPDAIFQCRRCRRKFEVERDVERIICPHCGHIPPRRGRDPSLETGVRLVFECNLGGGGDGR